MFAGLALYIMGRKLFEPTFPRTLDASVRSGAEHGGDAGPQLADCLEALPLPLGGIPREQEAPLLQQPKAARANHRVTSEIGFPVRHVPNIPTKELCPIDAKALRAPEDLPEERIVPQSWRRGRIAKHRRQPL
jgi:hypothetical protein